MKTRSAHSYYPRSANPYLRFRSVALTPSPVSVSRKLDYPTPSPSSLVDHMSGDPVLAEAQAWEDVARLAVDVWRGRRTADARLILPAVMVVFVLTSIVTTLVVVTTVSNR